ncbi:MAG: TonB-dependent receptor [Burkholderiales bacterium]|nr:TonB-dependent receptor [Burkholderiales bacterium]
MRATLQTPCRRWRSGALCALPALTLFPAAAQMVAPAAPPVVVTATRIGTPAYDVPAAIDRVAVDPGLASQALVNLSEQLAGVPGLLARDRQNYAQDLQISVRGFGARSTFGIRGVRLYVDEIPATLPDGQGQISNVDLGSAERIEVLRGPFSALYGNSAGGVIQVFTEDGHVPPALSFGANGGSWGSWRLGAKVSGTEGAFGYVASASRFRTDGWRVHSAAERSVGNLKATLRLGGGTTLTLIGNRLSLPSAQDPMGLTRAQLQADPRGVDPAALAFDTRKSVGQTQGGAIVGQRIDAANALRLLVYGGQRQIQQYQSIPVGPQASPLNPGGVIGLARNYSGADLRWTFKPGAGGFSLVGGLAWDTLNEHRQGWQNFIGSTLGVQGALRRDETNRVTSLDPYVQASWRFAPAWTLDAGVRRSHVRFESRDHYIVGPNPDDSGSATYAATLPVAGVMFALSPTLHLYANAGRGFETPTLNELAYRPGGQTGLNFGLQPATSRSAEFGLKTRDSGWGRADIALFQARTEGEIVTLTNLSGRATFQNAGSTQRRGVEASWSHRVLGDLRLQAAATWLDARYRSSFTTCAGTPCSTPTQLIAAGNLMPGLARASFYAAAAWQPEQGWHAGAELRALSRVAVNDANSDYAAGFAVASVNAGYLLRTGRWRLNGFARLDNLFDARYVGSVIVGDGNGRYFEPAPGRTWLAGVSAALEFGS